jgi:hypothetical protein
MHVQRCYIPGRAVQSVHPAEMRALILRPKLVVAHGHGTF